jgi:hypothetical protein
MGYPASELVSLGLELRTECAGSIVAELGVDGWRNGDGSPPGKKPGDAARLMSSVRGVESWARKEVERERPGDGEDGEELTTGYGCAGDVWFVWKNHR